MKEIYNKEDKLEELFFLLKKDGFSITNHYLQKINRYIRGCSSNLSGGIKIGNCSQELVFFLEKIKNGKELYSYLIERKRNGLLSLKNYIEKKNLNEFIREYKIFTEEQGFGKDISIIFHNTKGNNTTISIYIDNLGYNQRK